jgi:uncharacterized protein YggE
MKRILLFAVLVSAFTWRAGAQSPEMKIVADTLVVQAEGSYEAAPDLAMLTFDITSQEKDMKTAYANASASMQRIVNLASQNGLRKEDVSTGVLTVSPSYQRDRKNNAKSYTVSGTITLKIHDFSSIGPLLDAAVQEGIVDFRSLTYSLQDEESAKERAVADAMRRANGRAASALAQTGQKAGLARFVNVEVRQLVGVQQFSYTYDTDKLADVPEGVFAREKPAAAPPPPPVPVQPGKISVSATVQCAFEIK